MLSKKEMSEAIIKQRELISKLAAVQARQTAQLNRKESEMKTAYSYYQNTVAQLQHQQRQAQAIPNRIKKLRQKADLIQEMQPSYYAHHHTESEDEFQNSFAESSPR